MSQRLTTTQVEQCLMDGRVSHRYRGRARASAHYLQDAWLPAQVGLTGTRYDTQAALRELRRVGIVPGGWIGWLLFKWALTAFVELLIKRWLDSQ